MLTESLSLGRIAIRIGGTATGLPKRRARLLALDRLRETLGYRETLRRGYAVVRADGAVATRTGDLQGASAVEIEFADGRVRV